MMCLYCYRVTCPLLYSSVGGPHLIGSLDSDRSCHCSSGGPPGSGHCRIYRHLVPEEVTWKLIGIRTKCWQYVTWLSMCRSVSIENLSLQR